jgi:hypothetical protein
MSLLAAALTVPGALVAQRAADTPPAAAADSIQGVLADGSNFRVVKPAPWNGTIVLDLDFANNLSAPPSPIERWMTANGYAIGGISREPVAYRFRQAVDDLLAEEIDARSGLDLGPSRFIDHTPPEMLRPWDGSNWGSYVPCRGLQPGKGNYSCP